MDTRSTDMDRALFSGELKLARAPMRGYMASTEREPITGVWGRSSQRLNVQKKQHFGPFWEFWELK